MPDHGQTTAAQLTIGMGWSAATPARHGEKPLIHEGGRSHVTYNAPHEPGLCDVCGGDL
jgi:hypothetical protein